MTLPLVAVEQVDEQFSQPLRRKRKRPTAITSIWERFRMSLSGNMSISMRKHSMWNA